MIFFSLFSGTQEKLMSSREKVCKTDYALGISQQLDMVLHLLNNGQMVLHFQNLVKLVTLTF